MLKRIFVAFLFWGITLTTYNGSYGWGVWGHQHINRSAIFALPEPLRAFYFNHVDFITIEASIPDVRKYTLNDRNEGPRHYIDLETFGDHALDSLPQNWDLAKARYGEKKLIQSGILPWYIEEIQEKLTTAFKERDKVRILLLSADLAHYIGDAYMPLHTSLNHDGQLSGQKGVHALWESLLPELFGHTFNLHTRAAQYVRDPAVDIWHMLRESHDQVAPLLKTEKHLLDTWPEHKIYEMDSAGHVRHNRYKQPWYSPAFAKAYLEALDGMVNHQMQLAIAKAADFWYTAWVNAGKPDLTALDDPYAYRVQKKRLGQQYTLWARKGKLVGVRPSPEF